MKNTAPSALSERPVEEEGLVSWANDEVVPLLRQMRQALNAQLRERPTTSVTDGAGTYKRLWTSDPPATDAAWWVIADVVAINTSGAAQSAGYTIAGLFRSTAGVVAAVGSSTTVATAESAAAIDARFGVDATARVVYLEGRDNAVSPMRFAALVRLLEAIP